MPLAPSHLLLLPLPFVLQNRLGQLHVFVMNHGGIAQKPGQPCDRGGCLINYTPEHQQVRSIKNERGPPVRDDQGWVLRKTRRSTYSLIVNRCKEHPFRQHHICPHCYVCFLFLWYKMARGMRRGRYACVPYLNACNRWAYVTRKPDFPVLCASHFPDLT